MAPFLFVNVNKRGDDFAVITGDKILFYSTAPSSCCQKGSPLSYKDGFSSESSGNSSKDKQIQSSNALLSACVSNCGQYIAAADCNKKLYLWNSDSECVWKPLSSRIMSRKAYKVIFNNSNSEIIVADRGGDVFSFSVRDPSEKGVLILGHISIILDMCLTSDDRYLLTCDRDGKIRVSMYPNCYNIHMYCLGHEEFISSMCVIGKDMLVSGSGDGSLVLWRYASGLKMTSESIHKSLNSHTKSPSDKDVTSPVIAARCIKYSNVRNVIAVLLHPNPSVHIYKISTSSKPSFQFICNLSLNDPPLDAYFDSKDNLWIITMSKDCCVQVFQLYENEGLKLREISSGDNRALALDMHKTLSLSSLRPFDVEMSNLYKQVGDFSEDNEPKEKIRCNQEQ